MIVDDQPCFRSIRRSRERSVIGAETFRANHADHVSLQEPIVS